MKKLIFIIIIAIGPLFAMAQQPKMHIKLFGGWNSSTMLYRAEGVDPDYLHGWQTGGGFRVMHRKAFVEIDVTYLKYGLTLEPNDDPDFDYITDPLDIRMRALEFPLCMGWIPVKKPAFKWFLYGGLVSKFSLKGQYTYQGETNDFKPKELELHIYNLGARAGTQIDIAMFNFDINYTIGITNALKNRVRTNYHGLQFSAGFAF